jgi:hypothetical protein
MFCCVEFPEEETPEVLARVGAEMLALLTDADSFWFAALKMMFTPATTKLVM